MKTIGALLALGLMTAAGATSAEAPPVRGATICGDRTEILKRLEQRHEETPQALGLSADGGVLEILASTGGSWTILITYPKRPSCVVSVGTGWQVLPVVVGEPA